MEEGEEGLGCAVHAANHRSDAVALLEIGDANVPTLVRREYIQLGTEAWLKRTVQEMKPSSML